MKNKSLIINFKAGMKEHILHSKTNKTELLSRSLGILFITIFFSCLFQEFSFSSLKFYLYALSIFLTTTIIWYGCMQISKLCFIYFDLFKTPVRHLITLSISLIVFTIAVILLQLSILKKFFLIPISLQVEVFVLIISVLITLFITTLYSSLSFFEQWKINMVKAEKLERANLEAQYETLKNQVNPHFLFNSLNTLLTMVEADSKASMYVESLSEFLRYVLKSREKEAVLLRDELQMAKKYLFLQQSRFGEKLKVRINVPESDFHYATVPLALQMLIENAIKHNEISKEHQLLIEIYTDSQKNLVVENNIQKKINTEPSTGVGLINIRNRYKFLSGKDIEIKAERGKFIVSLPLVTIQL